MLVVKYTVNTDNRFAWISLVSLRRTITSEEQDAMCVAQGLSRFQGLFI